MMFENVQNTTAFYVEDSLNPWKFQSRPRCLGHTQAPLILMTNMHCGLPSERGCRLLDLQNTTVFVFYSDLRSESENVSTGLQSRL